MIGMGWANLGRLIVSVSADATRYNKVMDQVEDRFEKTAANLTRIGRRMTLFITAPLAAIQIKSVQAFAQFDKAITETEAVMGKAMGNMRGEMEATAKQLSTEFVFSSNELAEGFVTLARTGASAETAMGQLRVAAQFAQADSADLNKSIELLTDSVGALGLKTGSSSEQVSSMSRVANALAVAAAKAQGSVTDFAQALVSKAGARLRMTNKSLEEGVAILMAYAEQGIKSELAGERMNIMLRDLSRSQVTHSQAWKDLGISILDANNQMRPTGDILNDLNDLLKDQNQLTKTATIMQLGFQMRSIDATSSIIDRGDAINRDTKLLEKNTEKMKEMSEKTLQSFSNQMQLLANRLRLVREELGEALAPTIKMVSELLTRLLELFKSLPSSIQSVVAVTTLLVAALGPAVLLAGQFVFFSGSLVAAMGKLKEKTIALVSPVNALAVETAGTVAAMEAATVAAEGEATALEHLAVAEERAGAAAARRAQARTMGGRFAPTAAAGTVAPQAASAAGQLSLFTKVQQDLVPIAPTVVKGQLAVAQALGVVEKAALGVSGASLILPTSFSDVARTAGMAGQQLLPFELGLKDTAKAAGAAGQVLQPLASTAGRVGREIAKVANESTVGRDAFGRFSRIITNFGTDMAAATQPVTVFGKEAAKGASLILPFSKEMDNVAQATNRAVSIIVPGAADVGKSAKMFDKWRAGFENTAENIARTAKATRDATNATSTMSMVASQAAMAQRAMNEELGLTSGHVLGATKQLQFFNPVSNLVGQTLAGNTKQLRLFDEALRGTAQATAVFNGASTSIVATMGHFAGSISRVGLRAFVSQMAAAVTGSVAFTGATKVLQMSILKLTTVVKGLWVALAPAITVLAAAAVAFAAFKLTNWISGLTKVQNELERTNEKLQKTTSLVQSIQDRRFQKSVSDAADMEDVKQRAAFVDKLIASQQRETEGLAAGVSIAKQVVTDLDTAFKNMTGNKRLADARAELKEADAALAVGQEKLNQLLNLRPKSTAEGFIDPALIELQEKMNDELAKMNDEFAVGAAGSDEYKKEIIKLDQEIAKFTDDAKKAGFDVSDLAEKMRAAGIRNIMQEIGKVSREALDELGNKFSELNPLLNDSQKEVLKITHQVQEFAKKVGGEANPAVAEFRKGLVAIAGREVMGKVQKTMQDMQDEISKMQMKIANPDFEDEDFAFLKSITDINDAVEAGLLPVDQAAELVEQFRKINEEFKEMTKLTKQQEDLKKLLEEIETPAQKFRKEIERIEGFARSGLLQGDMLEQARAKIFGDFIEDTKMKDDVERGAVESEEISSTQGLRVVADALSGKGGTTDQQLAVNKMQLEEQKLQKEAQLETNRLLQNGFPVAPLN